MPHYASVRHSSSSPARDVGFNSVVFGPSLQRAAPLPTYVFRPCGASVSVFLAAEAIYTLYTTFIVYSVLALTQFSLTHITDLFCFLSFACPWFYLMSYQVNCSCSCLCCFFVFLLLSVLICF